MADTEENNNEQTEHQNDGKAPEQVDWEARYHQADERRKVQETRADKAEKALASIQAAQQIAGWKNEASKQTGVPPELLRGSTEKDIDAHAKAIKAYLDAASKPSAPRVSNPDGAPANTSTNSNQTLLDALFGKR